MTIKEFKVQYALGSLSIDDKLDLAYNKRTSKKILTILSTNKDWHVKCWVASNPNTPIEILKILSKDEDLSVKWWVASNPNSKGLK